MAYDDDPARQLGWNDAEHIYQLHRFRDTLSIEMLALIFAQARMRRGSAEDRANYADAFCRNFLAGEDVRKEKLVPRKVRVTEHDRTQMVPSK